MLPSPPPNSQNDTMNQLTSVSVLPTVTGHVDHAKKGHVQGWAYDPAHPQQGLKVEILCNDEVVAYGTADQFRVDLEKAGIGDGKHMFNLPLSYELSDGQVHTLIAREARSGVILKGGPLQFGPETCAWEFDLISRKQGLELLHSLLASPALSAQATKAESLARLYWGGSLAQETGKLSEARHIWHAILKALGENALCHCKLGETYLLQDQPEAALESYRAAAAADPCLHWAHLGIANAQCLLGRLNEEEEALEVVVALRPNDTAIQTRFEQVQTRALSARIDTLLADGKREEAIQQLKRLLLDNPEHRLAQEKLGELLLPEPGCDISLPGLVQLAEYLKAQRLLELFLDHTETLLQERASQ